MNFQPEGAPYEYEAYVPGTSVWAQMNKIGGGTPPKQYVGAWEYVLRADSANGSVLMEGTDLNIPLLATHAMAAKVAFEFLPEDEPPAPAVHIHVGHNVPGYLPESDVMCFDSVEGALEALRHEIKDQQDYYYEGCNADPSDDEDPCEWCDVAGDAEAALSAIADGDAEFYLTRESEQYGRIGWIFTTPEGPDMHHWAARMDDVRDDCEIFADQEA